MANHVIRDRIWESKKLTRCSRDAALAYPWIFLVADDWGRFEYDPRRIWSKAFGSRADVSLPEVTGWLAEYEEVGLLERFGEDGDCALWTGFQGRPPSQRRPSLIADPQQLKSHRRALGKSKPTPSQVLGDAYDKDRRVLPTSEIDRIGSEQSGAGAESGGSNPLVAGRRDELVSEGYGLIAEISKATGLGPEAVLERGSTGHGRYDGAPLVKLDTARDDRLLRTLLDLRNWREMLVNEGKILGQEPPPSTAGERPEAWLEREGTTVDWLLDECDEWVAANKAEGEMENMARGRWFEVRAVPENVLPMLTEARRRRAAAAKSSLDAGAEADAERRSE